MKVQKINEIWFIIYPENEGGNFATTDRLLFNMCNIPETGSFND